MRRVERLAIILCACAGSLAVCVRPAFPQSVQSVAAAAVPGVCIVLAEGGNGTTSGTGFVVADGFVLTAYHVVQGADYVRVLCPDHPSIEVKLVNMDTNNDLALLHSVRLSIRPLPLGDSAKVQVRQEIVVIGFPRADLLGAQTVTVTQGFVSAVGAGAMQIQAPVGPGNSGSPVLSLQGQVIGVVRAVVGSQLGTNFATSFATAIDAAKPLALGGQYGAVNVGNAPPTQQPSKPAVRSNNFVITPGRSIGDLTLGMRRKEIEALLGPASEVFRTTHGGFLVDWRPPTDPNRGFFAVLSSVGNAILIGVNNDPRYVLEELHTGVVEGAIRGALGEPSRVEMGPAIEATTQTMVTVRLLHYESLGLRFTIATNPAFTTNGRVITISVFRPGCVIKGSALAIQPESNTC